MEVQKRRCVLCMLSVGLPSKGKVVLYERVHECASGPVLFLSTCSDRRFVMRKFRTKTGSCIVGPFHAFRFVTEVGTLLQHANVRGNGGIGGKVGDKRCRLSLRGRVLRGSNIQVSLAEARCRVLYDLLTGTPGLITERFLLSAV